MSEKTTVAASKIETKCVLFGEKIASVILPMVRDVKCSVMRPVRVDVPSNGSDHLLIPEFNVSW